MEAMQDSDTPVPGGTDVVESVVKFFFKDDEGNYLAPRIPDDFRFEERSCVDEITKEMKRAEEGDPGYMAKLKELDKKPVNDVMAWSLAEDCGQVVLLPEAGNFYSRVKSGPSEIHRLKYGVPITLYDPATKWMRTLATPTVPENFHKFIIVRCPINRFPYYYPEDKDPYRLATDLFRIDFYDYPKDMKKKPPKPPPVGSLVYSNDQVQLVALRPSDKTGGDPLVRGYANPIYDRSIGDVEWKPSEGKVYTFHYGTARKVWDAPPPSKEFRNVEDEDPYPRR